MTTNDIVMQEPAARVLLVEDNEMDVVLFQKKLQEIEADQPVLVHERKIAAAVERLRTETFHVIFLDLNLPDDIGISSVKTIRRHAGKADIVVLTGMAGQATYEEAMQAGAKVVLLKHELTPALIEAYLPL